MKKILLGIVASVVFAFGVSAQVMQTTGIQNNLSAVFGKQFNGESKFHGFVDCFQARVDIAQFTIEGMINWGALATWNDDGSLNNFTFANTGVSPMSMHYNGTVSNNVDSLLPALAGYNDIFNAVSTSQEPYYVNFAWHPFDGFDVGVGTRLDWSVGAAPSFGGQVWEATSHVRQGGFSAVSDRAYNRENYVLMTPGSADVVGFVHYANIYAKNAIGVRYKSDGDWGIQIGGAIPNGATTDYPVCNLGFSFNPIDWLGVSAAYEGLFQTNGNLYLGANIGAKDFILDAYFAWDSIDVDSEDNDPKDMSYSLGAAVTVDVKSVTLRPEFAFNWFEETDYTPAWYIGCQASLDIADNMNLGTWVSFAVGSKNREWENNDGTKEWNGGTIFDIKPTFTFNFTKNNALSACVDIENRVAFDKHSRTAWSVGVFWTYKYLTGKLSK